MLAVERSELSGVVGWKTAGSSILWIVKPEPKMKGIGGCQSYIWIKAEDLVEQDRFDANVAIIATLPAAEASRTPCSATGTSVVISLCANQPPANNTGETH